MRKKLLEKYLNNNCNPDELKLVLSWFRDLSTSTEFKDELYNICEELPDNHVKIRINYDDILNKIHHEINLNQTKLLIEDSDEDLIKHNRKQSILMHLRNIAASLLLPFFGLSIIMSVKYYSERSNKNPVSETYNEVLSSVDAITKVTLPDGSVVWLNRRSSLRYPASFDGDKRYVDLKGEGYFEVTHDDKIPFIVNTNNLQIIARGTTFNVMAYPEEDKVETSLISGNVELIKQLSGGKSEALYLMNPADLTIYNKKSDEIAVRVIDDDRKFSWKNGKLVFTAEPMPEVIKKLSRWFNADIEINDAELLGLTLTATFVDETLPQVLELLTYISPISYTISNREVNADGTFSKRRVVLYNQRN